MARKSTKKKPTKKRTAAKKPKKNNTLKKTTHIKPSRFTPKVEELMFKMWFAGASMESIASKHGVHKTAIYTVRKKNNWEKRAHRIRKKIQDRTDKDIEQYDVMNKAKRVAQLDMFFRAWAINNNRIFENFINNVDDYSNNPFKHFSLKDLETIVKLANFELNDGVSKSEKVVAGEISVTPGEPVGLMTPEERMQKLKLLNGGKGDK